MATTVWPTVMKCVFVAFLHGGEDPAAHEYRMVRNEQDVCATVTSFLEKDSLVLERGKHQVHVPLPKDAEWVRMHYWWGMDTAIIDGKEVAVRMGPKTFY